MLKLNCDLGELTETENNDALIMPMIDQANIACGGHAGDQQSMINTVKLAKKNHVMIGAHPSYPDKANFGRLSMVIEASELQTSLLEQINTLSEICNLQQSQLSYVKPHGALYNDMMKELSIFETVCKTLSQLEVKLPLMIQALPDTGQYQTIANQYGITMLFEAFADRAYQSNGLLVPRSQTGAVLHQSDKVIAQISQLIKHQQLTSIDGNKLTLHVDSLCVHGDNYAALALIRALRKLLNEQG